MDPIDKVYQERILELHVENQKLKAALDFCKEVIAEAGNKLCGRGAYLDVVDCIRDKLWDIKDLNALFDLLEYGNNEFVRSDGIVQSILQHATMDNVLLYYKKLEWLDCVTDDDDTLRLLDDLANDTLLWLDDLDNDDPVWLAKVECLRHYLTVTKNATI